jgi:hypothetical protein
MWRRTEGRARGDQRESVGGGCTRRTATEPVKVFEQMTAPKDTAIGLSAGYGELAPAKMAEVGRAKLERWLDLASGAADSITRTTHAGGELGQPRKVLFGNAETVESLDKFFLWRNGSRKRIPSARHRRCSRWEKLPAQSHIRSRRFLPRSRLAGLRGCSIRLEA